MRKTVLPGLMLFSVFVFSSCGNNETNNEKSTENPVVNDMPVQDTIKKSIPAEVTATIAGADIKINYHSPGVKGRVIWGGLVPYNQVWVTGAHKATTIEVDKSFSVGDKNIPAGKYALFTIPGKEEWTVIINKNWNQHLADDYSEKEDVVRLKVNPEETEYTERLKYTIEAKDNTDGVISVSWEKIKVSFTVKTGS